MGVVVVTVALVAGWVEPSSPKTAAEINQGQHESEADGMKPAKAGDVRPVIPMDLWKDPVEGAFT
jgi:hypothetical protein